MSKKNRILNEVGDLIGSLDPELNIQEALEENTTENLVRAKSNSKQDLKLVFDMLLKTHDFIEVNGQLYIYDKEFG